MSKHIDEKPVQVVVNGRVALMLLTNAEDPIHLVIGALYTEKIISSYSEVESIQVDETLVSVVTKNPFSILLSRKTVLTGCGGSSSFLDTGKLDRVISNISVEDVDLNDLAAKLPKTTWFSGILVDTSGVLTEVTDVSAQSVMDRMIGYGLTQGISFSDTLVLLKGNISIESMRKAVIAGIPIVCIHGEVTQPALQTASDSGVLLQMIF
ncbi:MAG TPA: formate dehydrogenase accessory sulfurtransferase FdhD [Methanocorpusculum sp.]|nr:formate dehydrogenase accessory sulfurtransferase FdhD [Methanocorpusculum sp.]HJJ50028.1 formate dehydrogenase accessory sulfurtransferase FdhD [Methanocorpusculum sp.]HJJ54438.1 formate dehydrogenase accessory sulfurtransferase FdhD [Methanocorpusculum sp.]